MTSAKSMTVHKTTIEAFHYRTFHIRRSHEDFIHKQSNVKLLEIKFYKMRNVWAKTYPLTTMDAMDNLVSS